MLAPVLARLDRVPGVAESRVETTGRFFAIVLEASADEAAVAAGAEAAFRHRSRRLEPADAAAQLAFRADGDPWLSAAEVPGLCFLEARVLAQRAASAVGEAAGLSGADRDRLVEATREVLFAAMRRVLAEGGRDSSGWFYEEWPALASAIVARCGAFLDADRYERTAAALAALHASTSRA